MDVSDGAAHPSPSPPRAVRWRRDHLALQQPAPLTGLRRARRADVDLALIISFQRMRDLLKVRAGAGSREARAARAAGRAQLHRIQATKRIENYL
jgi:hypothetical protein